MKSATEIAVDMLRERASVGLDKYGVSIDRTDLSIKEWHQHAIEELLDGAQYLIRAKQEMEKKLESEDEIRIDITGSGLLRVYPFNADLKQVEVDIEYADGWKESDAKLTLYNTSNFTDSKLYTERRGVRIASITYTRVPNVSDIKLLTDTLCKRELEIIELRKELESLKNANFVLFGQKLKLLHEPDVVTGCYSMTLGDGTCEKWEPINHD